ncbi:MAG TPA: ClpXP protease specificity-enhancing factor [Coxiellaceae bacterium]|nr:ClpXP protease specificity-enhancing factor [Coxiellaceae bacterium]
MTPSRPYFIRAVYEWITDNGLTPHMLVDASKPGVSVPQQHVKDNKIVLNIAAEAVTNLSMANDWVNFNARFSGVAHRIRLPVLAIMAIYAVENGRGMFFDQEEPTGDDDSGSGKPPKKSDGPPSLTVVK